MTVQKVLYLVIGNNVYDLDSFRSLDRLGLDYVDEKFWLDNTQ